jgi:thiamine transport system substrate-binding protein
MWRIAGPLMLLVLAVAACGDAADDAAAPDALDPAAVADADTSGVTITLVTHDSFTLSEGILEQFTAESGVTVELSAAGDAGELVARSVLTAGDPEGDVLFGIDSTFLQRGLDAGLFVPYASPLLADVPDELQLDPEHRVTPIDVGDVCVNWWADALPASGPPRSLEDLAEPEYAATFVTPHPESSSPGFAFLLATIARFGEDGWQDYWRRLAEGGVAVTSGWSDAYYGHFVAGGGDRALVTSYATSPVAEVVFAESPIDEPPTGVLTDGCYRQIEFAGVLAGTDHPEAAAKLVDFLLSPTVQEDIPLSMFVMPANSRAEVPEEFQRWGVEVSDPLMLDPAEIERNRAAWTEEWVEIVLR